MARNFLVMVASAKYLVKFDGAETLCTSVPSSAEHFSYQTADRIVRTLRSRGFVECLVANISGRPATLQAILDTEAAADEYTVRFHQHYYFAGRDARGEPMGSRDVLDAKPMTHEAAKEVCSRLKRMKFKDAEVIDFASIDSSLDSELERVWEIGSSSPDAVTLLQD
jgi:hypothetical protein